MRAVPCTWSWWYQNTSSGVPGRFSPVQVRLMKLPALMKRSGSPSTLTVGSDNSQISIQQFGIFQTTALESWELKLELKEIIYIHIFINQLEAHSWQMENSPLLWWWNLVNCFSLLLTYYRQLDLLANGWGGGDLTLVEASITRVQAILDCWLNH